MDAMSPDAALDTLIRAIAERDLAGTSAALARRVDPAVIGSERGEAAHGRAAVEAFFARIYTRAGAFRFSFADRWWTGDGDVRWCVAEGSVVEPAAVAAKLYRLTAVLVREDGAWRLALWSGAEPA